MCEPEQFFDFKSVEMGIDQLNPFLRVHAPGAFRRLNVNMFRGKSIAIDSNLKIYSDFSAVFTSIIERELTNDDLMSSTVLKDSKSPRRVSARQRVMNIVADFVSELYELGITPIFVWDGTSVPEKTSFARTRRNAAKETTRVKIRELRRNIEETDIILRRPDDYTTLRKRMKSDAPVNPAADFPIIRSYIENTLGATCITAPDEAEKFCAFLAYKGIVAASYSTDTDSYPFRAPIVLFNFTTPSSYRSHRYRKSKYTAEVDDGIEYYPGMENLMNQLSEEEPECEIVKSVASGNPTKTISSNGRGTLEITSSASGTHFNAVVVPQILKELKMTHNQFVDFCIMFGCDFNDRVKTVGPETIFKLINKAKMECDPSASRLIEHIIATSTAPVPETKKKKKKPADKDWTVLNQERCREIFLDFSECEKVLEKIDHSLDVKFEKIRHPKAFEASRNLPRNGAKSVRIKGR